MIVEMKIFGLAVDERSQAPILILKDKEEKRVLPIWIGAMEAMAISISLNKVSISRPLTHDLMLNILNTVGAKIDRVVVVDLKDGTYYAEIHLCGEDQTYLIDSRPSDAIALAIRANAPIFANEDLLEEVDKKFGGKQEPVLKDEESEKWTEILKQFDEEDFKYKM